MIEAVNVTAQQFIELAEQVGSIGLWLQALGITIILWILFQIISLIIDKKNRNTLKDIKADIHRLEIKIDRLNKKI